MGGNYTLDVNTFGKGRGAGLGTIAHYASFWSHCSGLGVVGWAREEATGGGGRCRSGLNRSLHTLLLPPAAPSPGCLSIVPGKGTSDAGTH